MKSVFITGVSGFLGGYMARHFALLGADVHGTDSCSPGQVEELGLKQFFPGTLPAEPLGEWLRLTQADLVIHCAGRASVPYSMIHPLEDFEGNTRVSISVLDACRSIGFEGGVLLMSSAAVYGNPDSLPVTETARIKPVSAYGYHKWQAELLFEEYAALFGVRTAVLRIFSAYGAGLRKQVMWDLSRKILQEDGPLILEGTGLETRDFVHAADVARAAAAIAAAGAMSGECYNIAAGEEIRIADLAELLCGALEKKREIQYSGTLPNGVPSRWLADITKLKELGYTPSRGFGEGVAEYAGWAGSIIN